MAYSEFILTFNNDLSIGEEVVVRTGNLDDEIFGAFRHIWVNLRSQAGQVTKGTPTGIPGERSAINYAQAFALDHNPGGWFYSINVVDNIVTIKVEAIANLKFFFPTTPDPLEPNGPYPALPSNVSLTINNYTGDVFEITDVEFQEATINPHCTHYKIVLTTSELSTKITYGPISNPTVIDDNEDNPVSFEVPRGQAQSIVCEASDGQIASIIYQSTEVPQNINTGIYQIQIANSPNGATVTIFILQSINNPLEYSLDNSTWQTSNVFSGLPAGNYTLYVRDAYGCSFTETFTITEFGGARVPYFRMPKGNSIRFANRIAWGDCSNYKTDDNSLSCEADVPLPYKEIQQFQSCDIDTTQFRSNYSENLATIIKENGDEVSVPVVKISNYMGLKDRRDCRKFDLGNGKTGVYFISGNIYDYDTGIDTGNDYVLNGLLPDWAIIGTYFKLDTEWFLIEDTYFDEDVNSDVIVVSNNYSGADVLAQASAVYNLENFEEYEFVIDMVAYLNQNIQVRVNANDDGFENIEHLSELINVKIRQSNTKEIRYSNSTNTDINYSRGIEHKLRIPIEKVSGKSSDESEPYKTDSSALLLKAVIHDLDVFEFQPVTKQMMRKLVLALSHDTVRIDGVSYVKSDVIEVEGPLEETNLYVVTATMIKSNSVFNSNSGEGDNSFAGEAIEIPGLVDYNGGYVRY